MLRYETTKLFYDQYAYKLVVKNSLAHIFREKKFTWAKNILDNIQSQVDQGAKTLYHYKTFRQDTVTFETFVDACKMYGEFQTNIDYKLRVENPRLLIYSNDKPWLIKLSKVVADPWEFWEPNDLYKDIVNESHTIVMDKKMPFEYRVTLGPKVDPNLGKWLLNNKDKAKAGRTCIEEISNNAYVKGLYFYVRDEKILNLITLMVGKPQRVDKIVYKQDLDK